jgi:superfamily I DNA and/or RNA helicase
VFCTFFTLTGSLILARHEHLYTNIRANLITSEEFSERLSELHGCPVVLCTLSMLSSDSLSRRGAFRMVPVRTVVVDEASQIEIGDYIPIFSTITTIRKVTFIGDDMQCKFFSFSNQF